MFSRFFQLAASLKDSKLRNILSFCDANEIIFMVAVILF